MHSCVHLRFLIFLVELALDFDLDVGGGTSDHRVGVFELVGEVDIGVFFVSEVRDFAELGFSDGGSLKEVGAGGVFAHGVHEIKDCFDAVTLLVWSLPSLFGGGE